ncbi:MAG: hypothetical protein Q4E73_00065 [Lachnospiraceae bacterium]|nr:hypothetical protein [Lachnospiraceae bacterium]
MFLKLLKYDLKSMLKTMIPLWIALIAISAIMGIQIYLTGDDYVIMGFFQMGSNLLIIGFIALFIAVVVLNILIIIQRFWNGLLKEEGYLMFTLPVSQRKLILSKAVSALLISLGSILAVAICIFIVMESVLLLEQSDAMMFTMRMIFESVQKIDAIDIAFAVLLGILESASSIYHVYAAMAIGHLSNKNRFLCSFGAYIVISIVLNVVIAPIQDHFITDASAFRMDMVVSLVILTIEVLIFHVITELILTYRLNLE